MYHAHKKTKCPALAAAEKCLMRGTAGNCALLLLFLSNGQPSDHIIGRRAWKGRTCKVKMGIYHSEYTKSHVAAIASRFGRRLTLGTIGFGQPLEEFAVLKAMASYLIKLSKPSIIGAIGQSAA